MKNLITIFLLSVIFIGCSEDPPSAGSNSFNGDWTIPSSRVFDGGVGKDGIPSVDNPQFSRISEIGDDVPDDDLVVVVKDGDDIRAYPHNILDWHEIVNDELNDGNLNIAITYCPLTGTAVGWDREINGEITTFGVSGLLFNSNLMPYDRATDSYWSQMRNESVTGDLRNRQAVTHHMVEMAYSTFKEMFPNGRVMNRSTGFNRFYGVYPYGAYRGVSALNFPVENSDDRLFSKERVLGVQVGRSTTVYQFAKFRTRSVLADSVGDKNIVVFGSDNNNYLVAFFEKELDGQILEFTPVEETTGEGVVTDQLGNEWNVFGEAISGPNAGEKLTATPSYIGFYFSWVAFNEGVQIN